jgi:hypothetical protein
VTFMFLYTNNNINYVKLYKWKVVKVKVNFALEQALKAQRGCRSIVLVFNSGTR